MAELDSAAELRGCMQVARVAAEQVALVADLRGCMQVARVAAEQAALVAELWGCMQVARVAAGQVAVVAELRGCKQVARAAAGLVALAVVADNPAGEVDLVDCILLASAVVKFLVITNHPFVNHHLFPMLRA
jgi:hypothetical protein